LLGKLNPNSTLVSANEKKINEENRKKREANLKAKRGITKNLSKD